MRRVIALFGPTGVGKTAVAVALARLLRERGADPIAVSADALQVYRGLEVLTGVASPAEQAVLEHRLVGILPVTETCAAGRFAQLAHAEIDAALAAGRVVIVVGGTGLYLRAALADLDLRPPPAPGVRDALEAELVALGTAALYERLQQLDPAGAARVPPTDARRIVRALESGGVATGPRLWTTDTRHPTLLAGLTMDREELRRRIDERVDGMVAAGAAEEVRAAAAAGASATARQALGFSELLRGDVNAMKTRTRQYARRQLTWMRKLEGALVIDVTGRSADDVAAEILARA